MTLFNVPANLDFFQTDRFFSVEEVYDPVHAGDECPENEDVDDMYFGMGQQLGMGQVPDPGNLSARYFLMVPHTCSTVYTPPPEELS